jgi:drug/metabolite transporter (DMT)-like permease
MPRGSDQRPLITLVVATAFWGASSASVAHLHERTLATSGLIALAAAVPLAAFGLASRPRSLPSWRVLSVLGVLEAVNIAAYFAALRWGPTAPVVALHLSSPVILAVGSILFYQRRARWHDALSLLCLAAGVALLASGNSSPHAGQRPLLAVILAIVSACAVAALTVVVSRNSAGQSAGFAASIQLGLAGAGLLIIALIVHSGPVHVIPAPLAIGVLLLGPGFALYWMAASHLRARTIATVGLLEAMFSGLFATIVFHGPLRARDVISAVLVAIAVWLQRPSARGGLRRQRSRRHHDETSQGMEGRLDAGDPTVTVTVRGGAE